MGVAQNAAAPGWGTTGVSRDSKLVSTRLPTCRRHDNCPLPNRPLAPTLSPMARLRQPPPAAGLPAQTQRRDGSKWLKMAHSGRNSPRPARKSMQSTSKRPMPFRGIRVNSSPSRTPFASFRAQTPEFTEQLPSPVRPWPVGGRGGLPVPLVLRSPAESVRRPSNDVGSGLGDPKQAASKESEEGEGR